MRSRGRSDRTSRRAATAAAATLAIVLTACSRPGSPLSPAASEDQPVAGSFEEAALIALGEMFRVYGSGADPLPVEVTGEIDTHDGQPVWRIDGIYEVTVESERRTERWTLWIGSTDAAPLTVLSADGPG